MIHEAFLGGRDISFLAPYHIYSAEQLDSINSNLPVTYYYALNSAGIGGEGLLIHLQPVKEVGVGYVEHNELKVQIFFKYDFSSVKTRMYNWSTQTWTEFKQVPLT